MVRFNNGGKRAAGEATTIKVGIKAGCIRFNLAGIDEQGVSRWSVEQGEARRDDKVS
ncbi:hypothetical protein VEE55_29400 [Escherichia coli]|nr:hypothetical protein VEE55_29400 [Escherichia coli]